MEFPPEQERALRQCARWLADPGAPQVYYFAGFAGTGKTTLAVHLAKDVDGLVVFAAFTGKAAYVMRTKGCVGATTLHSLMYKPNGSGHGHGNQVAIERNLEEARRKLAANLDDRSVAMRVADLERQLADEKTRTARPSFALNPESLLNEAALVVVDECSMIDESIGRDLESFGVKILVLGDPAQLPPVMGGGYFTNRTPDTMLTQIHRQARESGILRLATDIREGNGWKLGNYGADCRVVTRVGLGPERLLAAVRDADQLLVGRNETRHGTNYKYREVLGRTSPFPEAGDKVVCLRNDHKVGVLNGSLWRVHEAVVRQESMLVDMVVTSEEDGGAGIPLVSHLHHFIGDEAKLKEMGHRRRSHHEFDFGYTLTVHKAQGSQWGHVLLFDESRAFRADAQKWLYTGITRAATELTFVVDDRYQA